MLCDSVWKVQKSHAANREGSFKDISWSGHTGHASTPGYWGLCRLQPITIAQISSCLTASMPFEEEHISQITLLFAKT